jgi:hypothetical protein
MCFQSLHLLWLAKSQLATKASSLLLLMFPLLAGAPRPWRLLLGAEPPNHFLIFQDLSILGFHHTHSIENQKQLTQPK